MKRLQKGAKKYFLLFKADFVLKKYITCFASTPCLLFNVNKKKKNIENKFKKKHKALEVRFGKQNIFASDRFFERRLKLSTVVLKNTFA